MTTSAKVAFLGLGVMGYPMAAHLKNKGGHDVTVYNRTTANPKNGPRNSGVTLPRHLPKPCAMQILFLPVSVTMMTFVP